MTTEVSSKPLVRSVGSADSSDSAIRGLIHDHVQIGAQLSALMRGARRAAAATAHSRTRGPPA